MWTGFVCIVYVRVYVLFPSEQDLTPSSVSPGRRAYRCDGVSEFEVSDLAHNGGYRLIVPGRSCSRRNGQAFPGSADVRRDFLFVYYESIKQEPKIRGINKCRCDERLQTKTKEFTRLPYTGLVLELERDYFVRGVTAINLFFLFVNRPEPHPRASAVRSEEFPGSCAFYTNIRKLHSHFFCITPMTDSFLYKYLYTICIRKNNKPSFQYGPQPFRTLCLSISVSSKRRNS
jgi:hypothetical protein